MAQWGLRPVFRVAGIGLGAAAAAVLLAGCGGGQPGLTPFADASGGAGGGNAAAGASAVVASPVYATAVGEQAQADRVAAIAAAVQQLRADSTSGWQARQDDASGYATDLSGGRITLPGSPADVARTFVERYGGAFGPAATFAYDAPAYDAQGFSTVRAQQVVGSVPVDVGALVVPVVRRPGGGEVSLVRGRVFDTSAVATTPTVTATEAARTIEATLGAAPGGAPTLAVFTGADVPRLAWSGLVVSAPKQDTGRVVDFAQLPANIYVDAQTGQVLGSRAVGTSPALVRAAPAASADLGKYDFTLPPAGTPVKVPGTLADGTRVQVNAERLADGSIVMVDATGPQADRRTKRGVIAVFDGSGLDGTTDDIGPVLRFPRGRTVSAEAVMAMWSARRVVDYYRTELGRRSFDGRNSPVLAVVNYTEGQSCLDNAYFATAPGQSRMMIGVPCTDEKGPSVRTFSDLYIIGHEITHGVTHTNALEFARNSTQQGAIDEGTSDYFGVVIENLFTRKVGTTGTHFACFNLTNDVFCAPKTNGQRGLRDVNSGATFDDYAFTLADPFGLADQVGDDGHANSMVWTNALWKARTRLAALDGGDQLTSARARLFDRAVNRATTTYLTTDSDLVDAAEAVQRATADVGMGAAERALVADQFRTDKLCRGCATPLAMPTAIAASARVKVRPAVAGDRVVYTQYDAPLRAVTMAATPGRADQKAVGARNVLALRSAAHGDQVAENALVLAADGSEATSVVLRNLSTGKSTLLSRAGDPTVAPAVSGTAVVWTDASGYVYYRTLAKPTTKRIPVDSRVAHLATDGTRVAIQLGTGSLMVWDVPSGRVQELDTLGDARAGGVMVPGGGLAMSGDRIAALANPLGVGPAVVYDLAKRTKTTVSKSASPFGITMNGRYVVWAEVTGPLPGRINRLVGDAFPDTELRGYSFGTGKMYEMVDPRGQQGFPVLGDRILAWQDTASGSNDIIAMNVPANG